MLIRGTNLTAAQVRMVRAAYVHRNTIEHPYPPSGGKGDQTDTQWIADHAFHFIRDGSRLSHNRHHCEPWYLAKGDA